MAFPSTNFAGFLNDGPEEVNTQSYQSAAPAPQWPSAASAPQWPQAPEMPSVPRPVFTGGRAARTPDPIDFTSPVLGPMMWGQGVPFGFVQLVELAGADEQSSTEVFLEVPENDWKEMIEGLAVGPNALTAMQRAAVTKHLKAIYEAFGFEPPALGGTRPRTQQPANTGQAGSSSTAAVTP